MAQSAKYITAFDSKARFEETEILSNCETKCAQSENTFKSHKAK